MPAPATHSTTTAFASQSTTTAVIIFEGSCLSECPRPVVHAGLARTEGAYPVATEGSTKAVMTALAATWGSRWSPGQTIPDRGHELLDPWDFEPKRHRDRPRPGHLRTHRPQRWADAGNPSQADIQQLTQARSREFDTLFARLTLQHCRALCRPSMPPPSTRWSWPVHGRRRAAYCQR